MRPDLAGILLPSQSEVQQWKTLNSVPLRQSTPSAVPSSNFIQMTNESFYGHIAYQDLAGLTACENVARIAELSTLISIGQDTLHQFYARRGISGPLRKISRDESTFDATIIAAATPIFKEIFVFVQDTKMYCDEAIGTLNRLFDFDLWSFGKFSVELIDRACELYLTVQTIDELKLVKTSFTNDFTFLNRRCDPKVMQSLDKAKIQEVRLWLATHGSADIALLKRAGEKQAADRTMVASAFVGRIREQIQGHLYLRPEKFNAYVRTLVFFARYSPPDAETTSLLTGLAESNPLIPLAYEVSFSLADAVRELFPRSRVEARSDCFQIDALKDDLLRKMSLLPVQIRSAEQGQLSPGDLFTAVTEVMKTVGHCKNTLRQQLGMKLTKPVPADQTTKDMCQFERSLRRGYTEQEMTSLLRILMVWRSATDTLRAAAEGILRIICPYFYESFQRFVKDRLEDMIRKTKTKPAATRVQEMFSPVLEAFGDWTPGEERIRKGKHLPPHQQKQSIAAPSPAAIEFVRIQLQHILRATAKAPLRLAQLDNKRQDAVKKFLADSALWVEFLDFGGLLADLSDQSDLFFREVQLDLNREALEKAGNSNFPVRASLPFILGEFALRNFAIPELTELIFFPLGVYDDAARVAQFRLSSQFMLTEIKVEAGMCVQNLSILISEYTYGSFRAFATIRFLGTASVALTEQLRRQGQWIESTPYRLSTLLQQNQFYLHCRQIDIKDLIFNSLENRMQRAIHRLLIFGEQSGISQFVAILRGLDIVRETHRLLSQHGFALLPFEVMLRVAMGADSANTFQSRFVKTVIRDLTHRGSKNYYLRTNPLRLFPLEKKPLNPSPFGGGEIGTMLAAALQPVANLITVEHFCCLARLLDDGAIVAGMYNFIEDFRTLASQFQQAYKKARSSDDIDLLRRIPEPPLSTPTQVLFERLEGVYFFLTASPLITDLLNVMQRVGNLLAFANMLDIGISNKRNSRAQIIGYLKGMTLDMKLGENPTARFGPLVAKMIESQNPQPTDKEVYPPVLSMCLSVIAEIMQKDRDTFVETSRTIFALDSLTGFAAGWSVLEFVFVLMEVTRNVTDTPRDPSPFELYGEGVMLTAAAVVCALQQERLVYATNIGRRLQRVKALDYSANADERLVRFCAVEQFEAASFQWAVSVYRPILQHIRATGLVK